MHSRLEDKPPLNQQRQSTGHSALESQRDQEAKELVLHLSSESDGHKFLNTQCKQTVRGVPVGADRTKAGRHLNQDATLRNEHFKHIEGRRLRTLRETAK